MAGFDFNPKKSNNQKKTKPITGLSDPFYNFESNQRNARETNEKEQSKENLKKLSAKGDKSSNATKSRYGKLFQALKISVTSSETITSIGNIVAFYSLWSGMTGHFVCGALAVRNQIAAKNKPQNEMANLKPSTRKYAFSRLITNLAWSPGAYRYYLSGVFGANALESIVRNTSILQVIACICFSVANLGAARILNNSYWKSGAQPQSIKHKQIRFYRILSPRVLTLLTNPGFFWCAGDFLLGVSRLKAGFMSSPLVLCAGLFAISGIADGLRIALKANKVPSPSSIGLSMAAATSFMLSLSNLQLGDPRLAISFALWGISSGIFAGHARKMKSEQ